MPPCDQDGRDCYKSVDSTENTCQVDCEGLYADVDFVNSTMHEKIKNTMVLESLMKAYNAYKEMQIKSMVLVKDDHLAIVPVHLPYHSLQVVQIYFSTATYDQ